MTITTAASAANRPAEGLELSDPAAVRQVLVLARAAVEKRLPQLIEGQGFVPDQLKAAMRHSLLGEGKRLRPILVMLMAGDKGRAVAAVDIGCAVEMVHTASLILDDLPCMDDAQTRRAQVATHVKFGQSTAILAAIALLTRSFSVISEIDSLPAETRARLVKSLADAVGQSGLAAGQELDVSGTGKKRSRSQVEEVNWLKTGKLFTATAEMAGLIGMGLDGEREALIAFAHHLGLSFQAFDDMLDATASEAAIGKDSGKDQNKATVVSLMGLSGARAAWQDHLAQAQEALTRSAIDPAPIHLLLEQCFGMVGTKSEATERIA